MLQFLTRGTSSSLTECSIKKQHLGSTEKKRQIAVLPVFQYTNAQKVLQGTFSLVPSWPWSAPFAALACLHQANRLQLAPDTGNQPN